MKYTKKYLIFSVYRVALVRKCFEAKALIKMISLKKRISSFKKIKNY